MGLIRRLLVLLTGHRIDRDDESVTFEELGGLTKIGLAIAFAGLLAAVQFGIAGWYVGEKFSIWLRSLTALIFGLIGLAIVLVLDRNFIYFSDTRYESNRNISRLYLGLRIFLVLIIGSLSSQFTVPLLLQSELQLYVQELRDNRFIEFKSRYQEKYGVKEKATKADEIERAMIQIKKDLVYVPSELMHQRILAEQCLRDYQQKLKSAFAPDVDSADVINLYASDKRRCERLDAEYKERYRAYLLPRQAELKALSEELSKSRALVAVASSQSDADLGKASANDEQNLNSTSTELLWSLLSHRPGSLLKYLLLTLLQLSLELMPMILKAQAGQSGLGHRIALRQYELKTKSLKARGLSQIDRFRVEQDLLATEHLGAVLVKQHSARLQELDSMQAKANLEQEIAKMQLKKELEQCKHDYAEFVRHFNSLYGSQTQVSSNSNNPSMATFGI